jgi:hypothetical protein
MDELDRMFRRLVHNVRGGFPDLLTRSFEVSALHQTLIPYRLNRTELAIDSAEEYELALTRLLAGTRGLLSGDPDMQAALQSELESPNPDLSLFRAWGTSTISINAAAVRALDNLGGTGIRTPSPAGATRQAEMAGRATLEVPASAAASTSVAMGGGGGARSGQPILSPPVTRSIASASFVAASSAPSHAAGCRYCSGEIPDGREVHFCPHCGQNLSIKQCPACSAELEVEWQFCISCGRQAE